MSLSNCLLHDRLMRSVRRWSFRPKLHRFEVCKAEGQGSMSVSFHDMIIEDRFPEDGKFVAAIKGVLSQSCGCHVKGVLRGRRAEAGLLFKGRHFDASVILLCVRW